VKERAARAGAVRGDRRWSGRGARRGRRGTARASSPRSRARCGGSRRSRRGGPALEALRDTKDASGVHSRQARPMPCSRWSTGERRRCGRACPCPHGRRHGARRGVGYRRQARWERRLRWAIRSVKSAARPSSSGAKQSRPEPTSRRTHESRFATAEFEAAEVVERALWTSSGCYTGSPCCTTSRGDAPDGLPTALPMALHGGCLRRRHRHRLRRPRKPASRCRSRRARRRAVVFDARDALALFDAAGRFERSRSSGARLDAKSLGIRKAQRSRRPYSSSWSLRPTGRSETSRSSTVEGPSKLPPSMPVAPTDSRLRRARESHFARAFER